MELAKAEGEMSFLASDGWFTNFENRNPDLAMRLANNLERNRAGANAVWGRAGREYSEPAPIRKTVDKKICTARPAETKKTLYGLHSVRKGGANKKTDSGLRAGTSKLVY